MSVSDRTRSIIIHQPIESIAIFALRTIFIFTKVIIVNIAKTEKLDRVSIKKNGILTNDLILFILNELWKFSIDKF